MTAAKTARKSNPVIIGLTGLYCAGKNYAAALLEKRGLAVLDLDRLGHEAIRTEKEAVVRRFGPGILGPDGEADRRLLGRQVFGNAEALAALEAIVHPAVDRMTEAWLERHRVPLETGVPAAPCVINAALLHRSSIFSRLDIVIVITAPLPVRFFRALRRDRLPPPELIRRFLSQKNFPFQKDFFSAGNAQLFGFSSDIYTIANPGFPGFQKNLEKRIDCIVEGL